MTPESYIGQPIDDVDLATERQDTAVKRDVIGFDRFATNLGAGIEVSAHRSQKISTVLLFGAGTNGADAYRGALPFGLTFEMSRSDARSLLGTPDASGEAVDLPVLGHSPAWDRWDHLGPNAIHCEYALDESHIALVSIMSDPPSLA